MSIRRIVASAATQYVVPVFVASASTQNTGGGLTCVVSKPSGTAQNDLMIAVMVTDGSTTAQTWTQDTGWTEVYDRGSVPNMAVAYKVAGSSEPASYTVTQGGSSQRISASILTFRYAAYDTIGTAAAATDPIVAPGITAAGGLLLGFFVSHLASVTCTTPSGMTALITDADATGPSYLVVSQTITSGATGTRSSSCGATGNRAGILFSLKAA